MKAIRRVLPFLALLPSLMISGCQTPRQAATSVEEALTDEWKASVVSSRSNIGMRTDIDIHTEHIFVRNDGSALTSEVMEKFASPVDSKKNGDPKLDYVSRCRSSSGYCFNIAVFGNKNVSHHVPYALGFVPNSTAVYFDMDVRSDRYPGRMIFGERQRGIKILEGGAEVPFVWWQSSAEKDVALSQALIYARAYDSDGLNAYHAARKRDETLGSAGKILATSSAVAFGAAGMATNSMTQEQAEDLVTGVYKGDAEQTFSAFSSDSGASAAGDDFRFDGLRNFTVDSSRLRVCVSDYECEDGDRVSVSINNQPIFYNHEILNTPSCRNVDLNDLSSTGTAFSGESFSIRLIANNGTGYKGHCSHKNVNTGKISISGGGGSDQWSIRGGGGTSSSVTFIP